MKWALNLLWPRKASNDAVVAWQKSQDAELIQAATGKGQWITAKKMPPEVNISGRLYRTIDGSIHRAIFLPVRHEVDAWFFPDPQNKPQNEIET